MADDMKVDVGDLVAKWGPGGVRGRVVDLNPVSISKQVIVQWDDNDQGITETWHENNVYLVERVNHTPTRNEERVQTINEKELKGDEWHRFGPYVGQDASPAAPKHAVGDKVWAKQNISALLLIIDRRMMEGGLWEYEVQTPTTLPWWMKEQDLVQHQFEVKDVTLSSLGSFEPVATFTESEPDMVNHPPHYEFEFGVEVIDLIEQLPLLEGNAIKYLSRAGRKGDKLEDLKKAQWYVDRAVWLEERRRDAAS